MLQEFPGMSDTVEQALRRALKAAGLADPILVRAAAASLGYEVRTIISLRVAQLTDQLNVATEWNEAIEHALLAIEGAS